MMTTTQVVETSVTINNNSPIQDYVRSDDHAQPTYEMTRGFKPFTHIKNNWIFVRLPRSRPGKVKEFTFKPSKNNQGLVLYSQVANDQGYICTYHLNGKTGNSG